MSFDIFLNLNIGSISIDDARDSPTMMRGFEILMLRSYDDNISKTLPRDFDS